MQRQRFVLDSISLSRQAEAEGGCSIEAKDGVVNGVDCQRLDRFEDFVREMVKEGHIRNMVRPCRRARGAAVNLVMDLCSASWQTVEGAFQCMRCRPMYLLCCLEFAPGASVVVLVQSCTAEAFTVTRCGGREGPTSRRSEPPRKTGLEGDTNLRFTGQDAGEPGRR